MVVYVGNHHGRPGVNELKQLAWELKKTLQWSNFSNSILSNNSRLPQCYDIPNTADIFVSNSIIDGANFPNNPKTYNIINR